MIGGSYPKLENIDPLFEILLLKSENGIENVKPKFGERKLEYNESKLKPPDRDNKKELSYRELSLKF